LPSQFWHARLHKAPAGQWLRGMVHALLATTAPSSRNGLPD
jgi:hypothetical protein